MEGMCVRQVDPLLSKDGSSLTHSRFSGRCRVVVCGRGCARLRMHHRVRLWNAAAAGDLGEVQRQLRLARGYKRQRQEGFKTFLNSANDANGHTALIGAVIGGHIGCINVLLGEGATLEKIDQHKMSPLHHCAINGHGASMKILLLSCGTREAQQVLLQQCDDRGLTPLDLAQVAQRDWVFARKRASIIGSFIEKARSPPGQRPLASVQQLQQQPAPYLARLLPPSSPQPPLVLGQPGPIEGHGEDDVDFQWTIQLLANPPRPMSDLHPSTDDPVEAWRKRVLEEDEMNEEGEEVTRVLSSHSFRGPMVHLSIHHYLWALALPDPQHQAMVGKAAKHSAPLRARIEAAKTLKQVRRIVKVLQPVLGITTVQWKHGLGKTIRERQLAIDEEEARILASRREIEEGGWMLGEDSAALKIRPYLTCSQIKLNYVHTIFKKLCIGSGGEHLLSSVIGDLPVDAPGSGAAVRMDALTPVHFARFCTRTGEILNPEKIETILANIRKYTTDEYGGSFWPPKALGVVEFTMFWLRGETDEQKQNELPEWMTAEPAVTKDAAEQRDGILPEARWMRRLRTREHVEKHAPLVATLTGRTSVFARIMSRMKHVVQGDRGKSWGVLRVDPMVHSQRENACPPPPVAKAVVVREKRKEEKLLVQELTKALGDSSVDGAKAGRIAAAQQKIREESSARAKVEMERKKKADENRLKRAAEAKAKQDQKNARREAEKKKRMNKEREKDNKRKMKEQQRALKARRHKSKMRRA